MEEPSVEESGAEEAASVVSPEQRRLLLLILGIGAGVLLLYVLFGVVLLGLLPAPDGGKQGLRLLGNALYAAGPLLALAGVGLFALRLLRSGIEPGDLITRLMRPGIGALAIVGFSGNCGKQGSPCS